MVGVDVVTLLAPGEVVAPPALSALDRQGYVRVAHHLVPGKRLPGETRVETIARARNAARTRGEQPYVMFLDRDVVLPDEGIEKLVLGLAFHRGYAALGINYQPPCALPAVHVAMGAVLFHRSVLERVRFRTEPGKCECLCCCEDVRALGYRIDYLPRLEAEHWKPAPP